MKKQWEQPKLIVLVRSKPEEAVLTGCKALGTKVDPGTGAAGCNQALFGPCSPCFDNTDS